MKSLLEERLHQLNWSHTASQPDDLVENASTIIFNRIGWMRSATFRSTSFQQISFSKSSRRDMGAGRCF